MSDYNRVILVGRLGNLPELQKSSEGKSFLRLSIATHSYRMGEKSTHWHRVVVFGVQAELCAQYLKKGSPLLVEGSLESKSYVSKTGEKRSSVGVVAQTIQFLGGRAKAEVMVEDVYPPEEVPVNPVQTGMDYATA